MSRTAVILLSGGIDSTVLLGELLVEGIQCSPLFVDYGQRAASRELVAAERISKHYNAPLSRIALSSFGDMFRNMLTDSKSSDPVFPARNMLLLTIASQIAYERHLDAVAIGIIRGPAYPDCDRPFLEAAESALSKALRRRIPILAPFTDINKIEVALLGRALKAPLKDTYSCFIGGTSHCGKCPSCIDRRIAMRVGK